jgi:hypothetical protein
MKGMSLVIAALLLFAAAPARAETAAEVAEFCKPFDTAERRPGESVRAAGGTTAGFCWGVFATFQRLSTYADADGKRLLLICAPPEGDRLSFVEVFNRYVRAHPERAQDDFDRVAIAAFQEAYSCRTHK